MSEIYAWTDKILYLALVVLRLWALIDCLTRRIASFPAVDKLTKPAWVAMLLLGAAFGSLIYSPIGPISLITAVIASVYLADVRPAVREVSGGTGR